MTSTRIPGIIGNVPAQTIESLPKPIGTSARACPPGLVYELPDSADAVADTAPERFIDESYSSIKDSVGNGFCVPLVQHNTSVGPTSSWIKGEDLTKKPEIKPGTVIATFNDKGKYESKAQGNHAAFFVRYVKDSAQDGVMIFDQFRQWPSKEEKNISALKEQIEKNRLTNLPESAKLCADLEKQLKDAIEEMERSYPEVDNKQRRFRRKLPGERYIPFGAGSISNNASNYSIVIHEDSRACK